MSSDVELTMKPYYLRIGHVDKVGKLLSVLVEDLNCESPVPHIGNRVQVSGDYFKVQEVVLSLIHI